MIRTQLDPQAGRVPWRAWLAQHFAAYTTAPFADRHIRFWEWCTLLESGVRPRPRVEAWPRGGGKSSTIELGCAYLGSEVNPRRHYVLYVSETQAQANKHVQAIAAMLERVGVRRALNEYGMSKGWRHAEIRTANGFNVTAFGLDSGMRGVKLDQFRPDLIVMDDIDGRHDTAEATAKKIDVITTTVLPAGSTDCAVIVIQNKITANSIVSQLCDGRADFLHDRLPATVEQAVIDLEYERVQQDDGTYRYRITHGVPTWEGQGLETCEHQLNEWGTGAFLREAQQDVDTGDGDIFPRHWWRYWQPRGMHLPPVVEHDTTGRPVLIEPLDLPAWFDQEAQSWDMTFKETRAGSYVVGLVGARSGSRLFLLDRYRERTDFPGSIAAVKAMTTAWPNAITKLIEDKANGPAVIDTLSASVPGIVPVRPDGSKEARASASTPYIEAGNWFLPHPQIAPWVQEFVNEHAAFPFGATDDQVDAQSQLTRYLFGALADTFFDDFSRYMASQGV